MNPVSIYIYRKYIYTFTRNIFIRNIFIRNLNSVARKKVFVKIKLLMSFKIRRSIF